MGGEVTVYSGFSPTVEAVGGIDAISSKDRPGISMPRIGGIDMPPLPIMSDIMEVVLLLEKLEVDDEEKEDLELIALDELMFIEPMFDIILFIIPSMSRLCIPPIAGMPPSDGMPMPGIDIIPPAPPSNIGPPDDIIVDEEDEDEVDLKLEVVEPSSDWVVAAML